jgi:hypothetical protein
MQPKLYTFLFASGIALSNLSNSAKAQTTLFDDTYSRGGVNSAGNLTPNYTGQTGADVGSGINYITYTNTFSTTPPNSLNIQNGTLFKSQTGQEGVWALNYNFTDLAILSAGGFSVSQNITSLPSNANTPQDRFCGYGVGLSLAQVNALNDDNASSLGPRGSITGGTTGVAAFYVDLDSLGAVQVFTGGTLLNTYAISGAPTSGTLLTDFTGFSSFNAGTAVDFTVLFDGTQVATGSFDWSSTGNNYIAGSMRDSTVTAGELNVSTAVPEPSTYAMTLGGLGTLTWLIRRRKV